MVRPPLPLPPPPPSTHMSQWRIKKLDLICKTKQLTMTTNRHRRHERFGRRRNAQEGHHRPGQRGYRLEQARASRPGHQVKKCYIPVGYIQQRMQAPFTATKRQASSCNNVGRPAVVVAVKLSWGEWPTARKIGDTARSGFSSHGALSYPSLAGFGLVVVKREHRRTFNTGSRPSKIGCF